MLSAVFSISRQAVPYVQLVTTIVPALVFQSYLTGIVAGKISTGNVSAGFKHAIVLTAITLILTIVMRFLKVLLPW